MDCMLPGNVYGIWFLRKDSIVRKAVREDLFISTGEGDRKQVEITGGGLLQNWEWG